MTFSARLKELREVAKLSQADLAELAELSKGGIADLEQGRNQPSWETVRKLAKALKVSCEVFNVDASEAGTTEKRGRGRPKAKPVEKKPKKKK